MFLMANKNTKLNSKESKLVSQALRKVKLEKDNVDFVVFDKMFFSFIFVLAVSNKTAYLYSSDNKKGESFKVSDIDVISIQKKVDLNLYLKNGRMINLTSVVGVKPKVMNEVRELNNELNKLR